MIEASASSVTENRSEDLTVKKNLLGAYLKAFEEKFGIVLEADVGVPLELLVEGTQSLKLDFAFDSHRVIVTAPIDGIEESYSDLHFWKLLERNFPNNDLAGAVVQVNKEEGELQLLNALPLRSLDALAVVGIAVNQALAAIKIRDDLKSLSQKTERGSEDSLDFADLNMQRFDFLE